jgi:hypothetical protein
MPNVAKVEFRPALMGVVSENVGIVGERTRAYPKSRFGLDSEGAARINGINWPLMGWGEGHNVRKGTWPYQNC